MALHLEDNGQFLSVGAVADVHHARILARTADHLRALGRQGPQPFLRGFVGTMFVPHRRKDAELGERGLPIQDLEDLGIFVGLDPVARDQLFGDGRFLHVCPPSGVPPPLRHGRAGGKGRRAEPRGPAGIPAKRKGPELSLRPFAVDPRGITSSGLRRPSRTAVRSGTQARPFRASRTWRHWGRGPQRCLPRCQAVPRRLRRPAGHLPGSGRPR